MAVCGGRPALGGPFPTLIARTGPGPGGGPDMAALVLLFYAGARLLLRFASLCSSTSRNSYKRPYMDYEYRFRIAGGLVYVSARDGYAWLRKSRLEGVGSSTWLTVVAE